MLAWLLLLGATLAMGAGAWWLLGREADRVEQLAAGTLATGTATVADNVNLLADEIKLSVGEGLLAARATPDPKLSLAQLVANNPYIAAGFFFRGDDNVTSWYGERSDFPNPSAGQPADEPFIGLPWEIDEPESTTASGAAEPSADYSLLFNESATRMRELIPRRQDKRAPTDIVEEVAETAPVVEANRASNVYYGDSDNAAIQQRAIVYKLNKDVQAAVSNRSINVEEEEPVETEIVGYRSDAPQADSRKSDFSLDLSEKVEFANETLGASQLGDSTAYVSGQAKVVIGNGAIAGSSFDGVDSDSFMASGGEYQSGMVSSDAGLNSMSDNVLETVASGVVAGPGANSVFTGPAQRETQLGVANMVDLGDSRIDGYSYTNDFLGDEIAFPVESEQQERVEKYSLVQPRGHRHNNSLMPPANRAWMKADINGIYHWLYWTDVPRSDDHLGAWLNRETLIAELAKAVGLSQQESIHFVLVDAQGTVVAGDRVERYPKSRDERPALTMSVGASLPGWQIRAYSQSLVNPFGNRLRLLGGLAVAGLTVTILLGASLMLWQAQRDAHEAQRKTTFVANVSHELKTPLTSIRMFAEMLHDGREIAPTKQQKYLQTMLNETQRLTRLVNNVLDFSRLERGRRDFNQDQVDLRDTVLSIIDAQRDRLSGEGLDIEFVADDQPIQVLLDKDALEQILLNLLDNAAKYASSGKRAEIRLEQSDRDWRLTVVDFGPGIPAAERRQVFEAFHRVDDRLTADRPGCGLGLSIAARLAHGLNGQLSLASNQPSGCCFTLTVPMDTNHV
ncbi:MAG: HAMP domain-containing sensor histidine kinase [Verrucomicrobiota bacterium]